MAALQRNAFALEAIALLADRDGGATLLKVGSTSRDTVVSIKAAEFIAATVETGAHEEEWVRTLFNTVGADALLSAAVTGLAEPAFPSVLAAQDSRIKPPPHFAPDYAQRLRLLEALPARVEDEQLRALVSRVREELQNRVAASAVPQPVP